jgi:uncharacterized membrane protein
MAKAKTKTKAAPRRSGHRLNVVTSHWKLFVSCAVGLGVGLAAAAWLPAPWLTDAIIAWDTTCLVFIGLVLWRMRSHSIDDIRTHAAREDQGRAVIMVMVIVAASASLAAVATVLQLAKGAKGTDLLVHIVLVSATVALPWFMMQIIFALRYAHEYYDPNEREGMGDAEGLKFPGGEPPDYWDFLHFAVVIGVACQTADIAITDKAMRRLSTLHSLVAFAFNMVIVALTINLLASLF